MLRFSRLESIPTLSMECVTAVICFCLNMFRNKLYGRRYVQEDRFMVPNQFSAMLADHVLARRLINKPFLVRSQFLLQFRQSRLRAFEQLLLLELI